MNYVLEIWQEGVCETAKATNLADAANLARGIVDEHKATMEAAGLVCDVVVYVYEVITTYTFK